jgi:hypothetical protein
VDGYRIEEPDFDKYIELKYQHIHRVCHEINDLADSLNLSDEHKRLAEIIALFHDLGRFQQFALYKTFSDDKSENHSKLAIKILDENEMWDFIDREDEYIIRAAIMNHNTKFIDPRLEGDQLFFTQLIRDADKLDIYNLLIDYYQTEGEKNSLLQLDLPDEPGINENHYQEILSGSTGSMSNMVTLNDFKLLQIGWIYDINFARTYQEIKDRKYLDQLFAVLPEDDKMTQLYSVANDFLENKLAFQA